MNPSTHQLRQISSRLAGVVVTPAELTGAQRDQMHRLLAAYFEDVTATQFEQDLAEKHWVILLSDVASGEVQGFSTLLQMRVTVDGEPVVAFFSGDTIIDRAYWGEAELPKIWGAHVFGQAAAMRDAKVYWFLISSGYKTYRFLSVFFHTFYPTYAEATPPAVQRVIDALARAKFGDGYDAATGIIRLAHASPLREGVAEVTPQRLKDPHVAFFIRANPGHDQGDQLACLVEISPDNVTRAGRRMLDAG